MKIPVLFHGGGGVHTLDTSNSLYKEQFKVEDSNITLIGLVLQVNTILANGPSGPN